MAGKTARYRCPVCGEEYPPHEAVRLGYRCHGQPLQRVAPETRPAPLSITIPVRRDAEETPEPFRTNGRPGLVEVVPPGRNDVDAGALQNLLGSLALGVPFSLEIAGDTHGRRFLVRAAPSVLPALAAQIEGVYGRIGVEPVDPEDDPARRVEGAAVAQAVLHLRRTEALPLRTFRDGAFRDADPILALLGAFGRLEEGERVLSQLVLYPAPPGWADRFVPLAQRVEPRTSSPGNLTLGLLVTAGAAFGVAIGLRVLTWLLTGRVLPAFLLSGVTVPAAYIALRTVLPYLNLRHNIDPDLVRSKIFGPAFHFRLRLEAQAPDRGRAERLLRRLIGAYRQFETGAGNGLVVSRETFRPTDLDDVTRERGLLWGLLPPPRRDIIGAAEAATLWHLPVGDTAELVRRVLDPRRLPRPEDVEDGVLIGTSVHQGREIPVHIPPSAAWRNKLLLARTQRGKTTLMMHLARYAMEDPVRAVIFMDPHGDAARRLLSVIPRHRVDDVMYLDFGDPAHVIGWNLLDVRQGFSDDVIVDAFVMAGRQMWGPFWGPRMEDVLRAAVRTLLAANRQIVARPDLGPEYQFTVLDIAPLLMMQEFQQRLRVYIQDIPDLMMWWYGYFDQTLHHAQRLEVINPVMSKINRLHSAVSVRRTIGLPQGTLDFWGVIENHKILLINLPGGTIGMDNAAFLGSFLLSYLETVIRSHQDRPREERPKVSFFLDECASVPYSYQRLLAELVKMGADFTLVAQSLHQLDAIEEEEGLAETVLANIDTLVVFQVAGADARRLVIELGGEVEAADLVNLPEHTCVVKTQRDGRPLPVMTVQVAPPPRADETIRQAVLRRRTSYTVTAAEADEQYRQHILHYYQRPIRVFLQQLASWTEQARRAMEEEVRYEAWEEFLGTHGVPSDVMEPMRVAGSLESVPPPDRPQGGRKKRRKRGQGGKGADRTAESGKDD